MIHLQDIILNDFITRRWHPHPSIDCKPYWMIQSAFCHGVAISTFDDDSDFALTMTFLSTLADHRGNEC